MFNDTQTVTVRWSSSNRMWFQSLGYIYTKLGDEFIVVAHDLMPHSGTYVEAICDCCGREYETQYASIISGRNVIAKDCCSNCAPQKASDVSKRKRAEKYFALAEETCIQRGHTLLTQIQEYTDVKMHIDFLCPRHGRQSMMLDNFVRGHECRECSYEKRARELKYDPEYVRLETKAHDKVKNEYCQSHGIHLLRIPYWDEPNIETIITTNLGI